MILKVCRDKKKFEKSFLNIKLGGLFSWIITLNTSHKLNIFAVCCHCIPYLKNLKLSPVRWVSRFEENKDCLFKSLKNTFLTFKMITPIKLAIIWVRLGPHRWKNWDSLRVCCLCLLKQQGVMTILVARA